MLLLLFPKSDRCIQSRVVDAKFRESPIIKKRRIFIILRIFFVFVIIVTVSLHAVQDECAGLQQQTGASRLSHDSARDHAPCAVMQYILAPMHLHT